MCEAFDAVLQTSLKYKVDMRTAAYIVAINRVAPSRGCAGCTRSFSPQSVAGSLQSALSWRDPERHAISGFSRADLSRRPRTRYSPLREPRQRQIDHMTCRPPRLGLRPAGRASSAPEPFEQPCRHRRRRARRRVGRKADQQALGPAELARGDRNGVGSASSARNSRALRARRISGRADRDRASQIAHRDVAHVRVDHLGRTSSIAIRSRRRPGGTSNTARAGVSPGSSTQRRTGRRHRTLENDGAVVVSAVSTIFDGVGWRDRSPGTRGVGSQTNVTRVLPSAPRDTPNHGRMSGLTCGAARAAPPAWRCLARSSSSARMPSSGEGAQ